MIVQCTRLQAVFHVCYSHASLGAHSILVERDTCVAATERSSEDSGDWSDEAECRVEFGTRVLLSKMRWREKNCLAMDWSCRNTASVAGVQTGFEIVLRKLDAEEWFEGVGVGRR